TGERGRWQVWGLAKRC
nr:Chain C, ANTI-INDUCER PEPTIDE TAP2 [Escherichia coli]